MVLFCIGQIEYRKVHGEQERDAQQLQKDRCRNMMHCSSETYVKKNENASWVIIVYHCTPTKNILKGFTQFNLVLTSFIYKCYFLHHSNLKFTLKL